MNSAQGLAGGKDGLPALSDQRIVTCGRILQLLSLCNRDRGLGEAFESEILDISEFDCRLNAAFETPHQF